MSESEWTARSACLIETLCDRLACLESRLEALEIRLKAVENRMNVQIGLTLAMWFSLVVLMVMVLIRQ